MLKHPLIIRSFVETYRHCPMCGSPLEIEATHCDGTHSYPMTVATEGDRLTINVRSDYFVSAGRNSFEFAISIVNGQMIHCNQTNQFVSLYDLDIILTKECKHCVIASKECFKQSINLFYDRSVSMFVAEPWIDMFAIVDSTSFYYFCNNFKTRMSFLSVQSLDSTSRRPPLNTPFIPFDKFNFADREKLLHKLQSIQLLY